MGHLKSLSQGSFVLQQLQRQLGRSGYESLWGAAVRTTSTQTQQHMALVRYWEALESRMSCFWAGLSLSNAGQVGVCAQRAPQRALTAQGGQCSWFFAAHETVAR